MVTLKPGARLRSTVCSTEVVAVRAPADDIDVRCGGAPLVALDEAGEPSGTPEADLSGGTQVGKRYTDEGGTLELLCTKAGAGSLSIGDQPLGLKEAKPLPASD
jgi:hypothetical protein